jgi:hypothetical protein
VLSAAHVLYSQYQQHHLACIKQAHPRHFGFCCDAGDAMVMPLAVVRYSSSCTACDGVGLRAAAAAEGAHSGPAECSGWVCSVATVLLLQLLTLPAIDSILFVRFCSRGVVAAAAAAVAVQLASEANRVAVHCKLWLVGCGYGILVVLASSSAAACLYSILQGWLVSAAKGPLL